MSRDDGLIDRIVKWSNIDEPNMLAHDLETETKKMADGSWDPMPYGPAAPKPIVEAMCDTTTSVAVPAGSTPYDFGPEYILVGANWKFDYQHCKRGGLTEPPSLLWDVLVAEYLITGQDSKFPSLAEVMKKYLGYAKKDLIGESLKNGIPPQKIDIEELKEYARSDAKGTYLVARKQWAACPVPLRRLILVQSMATLAYGDAEYNGMPLDKGLAIARRDEALKRSGSIQTAIRKLWAERCSLVMAQYDGLPAIPDWDAIDPEQFVTPRAISSLLFGFPAFIEVSYKMPTPVGRKRVARYTVQPPVFVPLLPPGNYGAKKHSDGKSFLVSEEVLSQVRANAAEPYNDIAGAILKMREAHKLGTTYYQNLIEFSERHGDNLIHPTIHAMSTATGRTSSANPNAQNQPDHVREVIVAPEGHKFVEFDFSQLEVVALAHVSNCPDLKEALRNGDDIHFLTGKEAGLGASWKSKDDMPKDVRRNVKSVVFGLIYGGGAATLSAQSGVPVDTVKKIINAFYTKFPGTKRWQDAMIDVVNGRLSSFIDLRRETVPGPGGTLERCTVRTTTGRRYAFTQQEAPEFLRKRGINWAYSPTQIKNYFVQGFATGDVVPLAVTILREWLREGMPNNKLTMMVHDSVLQAVPEEDVPATLRHLAHLPTAIEAALSELWGIDLGLPLKIEVKVTDRWSAPE